MNKVTAANPLAAIVSTYAPEDSIGDNLQLIAAEVDKVFLINDSGSADISDNLEKKLSYLSNVTVLHNKSNLGLARSLNIAIKTAEKSGFGWVMVFDDDTTIKPGSIKRLQGLASSDDASTNIYSLARINARNHSVDKPGLVERKVTITSGSYFSIRLFNALGGFDEAFHIDFLDFDFCFRTHSTGGRVLQTSRGEIFHRVGNPLFKRIFFFRAMTHNHRPARYYYHYRSAVLLTKRHCLTQPLYIVRLWSGLVWKFVKMLALETSRIEKLKFLVLGTTHGLINQVRYSPKV